MSSLPAARVVAARAELQPRSWTRAWTIAERRMLLLLGDLVITVGAMLVTRSVGGSIEAETDRLPLWVLLLVTLWVAVARVLRLYDLVLAAHLRSALPRTAVVAALTIGLYSMVPYWSPPLPAARWLIALHAALMFGPLLTWRTAYALFFARPSFRIRTLILGRDEITTAIVEMLRDRARHEYELIGLVDHRQASNGSGRFGRELLELVQSGSIREVILDTSARQSAELQATLLELAERGVTIANATEVYESITGRVLLPLSGSPWLKTSDATTSLYLALRRLADAIGAAIGLVFLAPVLLVAALAIMLDSPGHPLYWQERVGRFGRPFRMFKLRTMIEHAEGDGHAVWASGRDPRVTRVGAFLRHSRLDEVPQLWNVLRGEMSLIGPRPERSEFVSLLTSRIPIYRARHVIRPGITGWAQVEFGYASSIEEAVTKLAYDLYYICHRSPLLDATIVLKTLVVVLRLKGI